MSPTDSHPTESELPPAGSLSGWAGAPNKPPNNTPNDAPVDTPVDICQGGVLLRTLLFVHGVVALALAFNAPGARAWLAALGLAVAVALPATLLWLVTLCAGQRVAVRWMPAGRWAGAWAMGVPWLLATGLGALCVALVWSALAAADLLAPLTALARSSVPAALAPPLAGAALAAAVWHWLLQRARLQVPATTQARLAELQSRIRPHFLFNALNSAVALVRHDPPRAEGVLEDLAELFRAALVGSGEQVTLGEEIELARRYLAIEQVRFGARLQVRWQIDAAASTARVPSLLLQPLVENAVKHGVETSDVGSEVHIRTQRHRGQALISITNTLSAGPGRRGQGMALRNVRERLLLLHDLTMRFEAGEIDGGRYRVRIAVPMQG